MVHMNKMHNLDTLVELVEMVKEADLSQLNKSLIILTC